MISHERTEIYLRTYSCLANSILYIFLCHFIHLINILLYLPKFAALKTTRGSPLGMSDIYLLLD